MTRPDYSGNVSQMAKSESTNDLVPFDELLKKLEGVVEQLERGDLALEKSLTLFEEGVRLSRLGNARLDEVERRVEVLLADEETVRSEPFESTAKEKT